MEVVYELDFDDIIEEDGGSDDNDSKEDNLELVNRATRKYKERVPPRTEHQLEILKANAPPKTLTTKEKAIAWEQLTIELNKIGPPIHDWLTWRTVWRSYKAKGNSLNWNKQKRLIIPSIPKILLHLYVSLQNEMNCYRKRNVKR